MIPFRLFSAVVLACTGAAVAQTACHAPAENQFPDLGGPHVTECSALPISHYPPTSGAHFPIWANPGTYHALVNAGYWLHAAEHGSVIFLINCHLDPDCEGDFARFQAIADAFPLDTACTAQEKHRIVISGDTLITTRYAAVAWNWSLLSDCLDTAAFAKFLKDHYAQTYEDFCGGGTNFTGSGWCNAPLALAPARSPARRPKPAARTWRAALWPGLPEDIRPDGKSIRP